jgi:hypothetical protein
MSERFYSSDRDDTLAVRDGSGPKQPFHNRFDYKVHMTEHARLAPRARLAFDLLTDALDCAPSREVQDYFVHRVMPLLPPRFTISRSRVLAYVERIADEQRAEMKVEDVSLRSARDQRGDVSR